MVKLGYKNVGFILFSNKFFSTSLGRMVHQKSAPKVDRNYTGKIGIRCHVFISQKFMFFMHFLFIAPFLVWLVKEVRKSCEHTVYAIAVILICSNLF